MIHSEVKGKEIEGYARVRSAKSLREKEKRRKRLDSSASLEFRVEGVTVGAGPDLAGT